MKRIALLIAAFALAVNASAAAAATLTATVSLSSQTMTVTHRGRVIGHWPVSTARRGKVTPTGAWTAKWLSRHHKSSRYNNAPMPYSIFYNGNYAVHGTYQTNRLGRPGLGRLRASFACPCGQAVLACPLRRAEEHAHRRPPLRATARPGRHPDPALVASTLQCRCSSPALQLDGLRRPRRQRRRPSDAQEPPSSLMRSVTSRSLAKPSSSRRRWPSSFTITGLSANLVWLKLSAPLVFDRSTTMTP